jgi:hypothetical protein
MFSGPPLVSVGLRESSGAGAPKLRGERPGVPPPQAGVSLRPRYLPLRLRTLRAAESLRAQPPDLRFPQERRREG